MLIARICCAVSFSFVLFCGIAMPAQAALSSAAEGFAKEHGYPEIFISIFQTKEISPGHKGFVDIDPPQRTDAWLYAKQGFRVKFVNGVQQPIVKFNPAAANALLPGTKLKPSDFDSHNTKKEIENRFGKPDLIETAPFASHLFEAYRYTKPGHGVKSFTFLDGQLVGVCAGVVMINEAKPQL